MSGTLVLGAQRFPAAFETNPSAGEYLYSAARAEHLSGNHAAARRNYRRYLAGAPKDHALRARAEKHLAGLPPPNARPPDQRASPASGKPAVAAGAPGEAGADKARAALSKPGPRHAPGAKATPTLETTAPAAAAASYRPLIGWTAVAAGAIGLGVGAWLAADAYGRRTGLEDKTAATDGGPIIGISHEEAIAEANTIDGDLRTGSVVIGAGAAIAVLGGWLVWSAPSRVQVRLSVGSGAETMAVARWGF